MAELEGDEVTNCEEIDVTKINKPELTKCAQALQTRVRQMKAQNQTIETDKTNLDQELTKAKTDNDTLANDKKKLSDDYDTLANDKKKLSSDYDTLKVDYDTMHQSLKQEKNDKIDLVQQLADARSQLNELKTSNNELLEMIGSTAVENNTPPAKVFLLIDTNIADLKKHVGDKVLWDYCEVTSMNEVYDIIKHSKDKLESFDRIVTVLGSQDILDLHKSVREYRVGQQGQRAFVMLQDVIKKLSEYAPVTVVQIPPINNPKMFTDVTFYNYKIRSTSFGDDVDTIVDEQISDMSRSKLITKDSCVTLSQYGAEVFGNLIQTQMTIPEPRDRQKSPKPNEPNVDYTHFMKVPPGMTGAVIGEEGNTIQSITRDTKVRISFGTWSERPKKPRNRDAPPPKPKEIKGILITGKPSNISAAQKRVMVIMDEEDAKKSKTDEF